MFSIEYLSFIIVSLLLLIGLAIEYFSDDDSKFVYESLLHLITIPIVFIVFYSYRQSNSIILTLSLIGIILIFIVNFFYRDTITKYRLYGSRKELINRSIEIERIAVKKANRNDTILQFDNGKYILDFWSLYCPGCYADMTILDSIYQQDNKLRLISLLTAYRKDTQKEFNRLNDLSNSYPSYYWKDSSLMTTLEIEGFPSYFILKNKKIIFRGNLNDVISEYRKSDD